MTNNKNFSVKVLVAALALVGGVAQAATIQINNINAAGVGFNDTTPAAPVGGNPGTTLGEQRLIAFTYAANIWGATLESEVPIIIDASFEPLTCTATSGTLGSAGATTVFRDFPGATKPATWYGGALANKLSGVDNASGGPVIRARFNSNLGLNENCLPGSPFYLGIDNNHGPLIDFPAVLLHEMGHGLGFQTFTSGSTGNQLAGFPAIWDHYMLDNRTGKLWTEMTAAERIASANAVNALVWTGANVTAAVPGVLSKAAVIGVSGPAAGTAAGEYGAGEASFGAPFSETAVTGQLMPVVDQANGTGLACNPLSAANALAVRGNIALVDRGVCGFTVKAANVQAAGAKGMIVVDNVLAPLSGLGGTDPAVTIPAARVTLTDGTRMKSALTKRSRTASGVLASLGRSNTRFAGTDGQGRIQLYTPATFAPGSSVSHFDTAASRNQLMEPFISGDLTHSPTLPQDLSLELFKDIGW